MSAAHALEPAIRIDGLTRHFGGHAVLDKLDLTIGRGEFMTLLGRSGSGKTTLLRLLARLDPPQGGELAVPGKIAVVFQESRLLPWMRVWQNVALGLSGPNARDRAVVALEEVGLGHRLDAWPLTLSGGEGQRVGIARAMVREPELLLLDEPFASLDALTRLRMQLLVSELWQKHRCAVLLVTHDVNEALLLGDRAVVLHRGRIRTDVAIALDRPRRLDAPETIEARRRLLEALEVFET